MITNQNLDQPRQLSPPELVSPDRVYDCDATQARTPDRLAWTPDGAGVIFSRPDMLKYQDGESLTGTSIWECMVKTGVQKPVAKHTEGYDGDLAYFRSPVVSSSGRHIAYLAEVDGGYSAIEYGPMVPTPVRTEPHEDDQGGRAGWPVWFGQDALTWISGVRRSVESRTVLQVRVVSVGSPFSQTPARFGTGADRYILDAGGLSVRADNEYLYCAVEKNSRGRNTWGIVEIGLAHRQSPNRMVSPSDGQDYRDPAALDNNILGAVRVSNNKYNAVILSPSSGAVRVVSALSNGDIDWSPTACAFVSETTNTSAAPSAGCMLQVRRY